MVQHAEPRAPRRVRKERAPADLVIDRDAAVVLAPPAAAAVHRRVGPLSGQRGEAVLRGPLADALAPHVAADGPPEFLGCEGSGLDTAPGLLLGEFIAQPG